jgi:hypothetical protein
LYVQGRKSFGGDAQEDDDAETHEMRRPQNEDGAVPIYVRLSVFPFFAFSPLFLFSFLFRFSFLSVVWDER